MMKNILLLLLVLLLTGSNLMSQSKTFDVLSFNPPRGWTHIDKVGTRTYSLHDNAKGLFGMIAIYTGAKSSGSAQKDFSSTWNQIVRPSLEAGFAPLPTPATPQAGYEGLQGTSYGKSYGKESTVTLINYTGGGKIVSIILNFNSIKYEDAINRFLQSLKLAYPGHPGN